MAQTTIGISLKWGTGTGGAVPTTWKDIPDVFNIPALSGEASKHDVTTFAQTKMKVYIQGLMDISNLTINARATNELYDCIEEIQTAQTTNGHVYLRVSFPAPLSKSVTWKAQVGAFGTGDLGVDAPVDANISITPVGEFVWADLV